MQKILLKKNKVDTYFAKKLLNRYVSIPTIIAFIFMPFNT